MKRNPYEKFKVAGVRGAVPANFECINVFDRAGESIVIFVGELDNVAYDFGYEINLKDNTHLRKLPGIGSGWFKTRDHAVGYALHGVRIAFGSRFSSEALGAVRRFIVDLEMPKLDLV